MGGGWRRQCPSESGHFHKPGIGWQRIKQAIDEVLAKKKKTVKTMDSPFRAMVSILLHLQWKCLSKVPEDRDKTRQCKILRGSWSRYISISRLAVSFCMLVRGFSFMLVLAQDAVIFIFLTKTQYCYLPTVACGWLPTFRIQPLPAIVFDKSCRFPELAPCLSFVHRSPPFARRTDGSRWYCQLSQQRKRDGGTWTTENPQTTNLIII